MGEDVVDVMGSVHGAPGGEEAFSAFMPLVLRSSSRQEGRTEV